MSNEDLEKLACKTLYTSACANYLRSDWRVASLSIFINQHGNRTEDTTLTEWLGHHSSILFDLSFCRVIDNFQTYLSHLLLEIGRKHPLAVLDKDNTVLLSDFVSHDRTDLIDQLLEKKIQSLSYGNIFELSKFFEKRKFTIAPELKLQLLNEWISIRNVFIHNAGVANKIFKERCPNSKIQIKDKIEISVQQFFETSDELTELVYKIDQEAAEKWGLFRREYIHQTDETTFKMTLLDAEIQRALLEDT